MFSDDSTLLDWSKYYDGFSDSGNLLKDGSIADRTSMVTMLQKESIISRPGGVYSSTTFATEIGWRVHDIGVLQLKGTGGDKGTFEFSIVHLPENRFLYMNTEFKKLRHLSFAE